MTYLCAQDVNRKSIRPWAAHWHDGDFSGQCNTYAGIADTTPNWINKNLTKER